MDEFLLYTAKQLILGISLDPEDETTKALAPISRISQADAIDYYADSSDRKLIKHEVFLRQLIGSLSVILVKPQISGSRILCMDSLLGCKLQKGQRNLMRRKSKIVIIECGERLGILLIF